MFAKVMRAIATALHAMLNILVGIMSLPFWLFGIRGRSSVPHAPARTAAVQIEPSPATAEAPESIADPLSTAASCLLKLHRKVMGRADFDAPSTGSLDPVVKSWAFTLTDEQAREAVKAGVVGLLEHLTGASPIPGLPPLTRRRASAPAAALAKADPRSRRRPAMEAETDDESLQTGYRAALI